ncbi:DMT family transporter [Hydrogenophaga sp. 5NK40-0174]|uniref:DMT family transporter n=1 Tax=Hydrogenophaga sp. 5NK40-0174 TaxID=3127649 RepID=UPI0031071F30
MTAFPASLTGNTRGIVAMLSAMLWFSLMDAVLKELTASYPFIQIAALRGIVALPLIVAWITWRGQWQQMRRIRWPLQIMRGAIGVPMLFLFTYALQTLPLSTAYTLFFVAPLLVTVFSVLILKEAVPATHWWIIGVGFLGVMVALRPGPSALSDVPALMAGLAVLGAATCYAISAVTARLVGRTDSSESMVLVTLACISLLGGLLAYPTWVPVKPAHGWLLTGLAITGFLGQLSITDAFRHGKASAVAPFEYSALAWGVGLDWVIWQALPDGYTWLGAAIIVASGVYLIRHEQRIARSHANPDHP